MAAPPNIEIFNQVAARAFVRLYEAFPSPTDLDPMLIGMEVVLEENYDAGSPHHDSLVASASDTIQYLIDESYIRLAESHSNLSFRGFPGAVLTRKGLAVLQKIPESVDENVDRRSYFERFKSATASGARVVATEAIGGLVARLLAAG